MSDVEGLVNGLTQIRAGLLYLTSRALLRSIDCGTVLLTLQSAPVASD